MWESRSSVCFFAKLMLFLFSVNLGYLILYANWLDQVNTKYLLTETREQLQLIFAVLTYLNTLVSVAILLRCVVLETLLFPVTLFCSLFCLLSTMFIALWLHMGRYWHDPIQVQLGLLFVALHVPYCGLAIAAITGQEKTKCT